jgi:hypothetical protein
MPRSRLCKGQNKNLTMWGHITRVQAAANVRIVDRLIDSKAVEDFELKDYDLSKKEGVESLHKALWENILKPAKEEQDAIARSVGGSSSGGRNEGTEDKKNTDKQEPTQSMGWGQMA